MIRILPHLQSFYRLSHSIRQAKAFTNKLDVKLPLTMMARLQTTTTKLENEVKAETMPAAKSKAKAKASAKSKASAKAK
jgi:hypothetical protein